ncbi:MAG: TlpA family protein disulfide reductase [Alphaproteobacteria bacterium]|nr:TlpA family protein disulfide reductase [Alphaproteobacteria bacterium]
MTKRSVYKKVSLFVTALFLLFFISLSIGYWSAQQDSDVIVVLDEPQSPQEDKPLKAFDFKTKKHFEDPKPLPKLSFLNPEGEKVSWDNFKGKYTLVNFWATWCGPCVVELPTLQELKHIFRDKPFDVVAVSLDMTGDQERLAAFLKRRGIEDFALYFDKDGDIQRNIPMRGIPTTFLLNPDGQLLYIFEGDANWSSPPSVAFFSKLLS